MMTITVSFNYSDSTNDLSVDLMGMKAEAQQGLPMGDCESYGYRNWDSVNPLKSSGYDCLCVEREKVSTDCDE